MRFGKQDADICQKFKIFVKENNMVDYLKYNQVFLTIKAPEKHPQLTFEDILFGTKSIEDLRPLTGETDTLTRLYSRDKLENNNKLFSSIHIDGMITNLKDFNNLYYDNWSAKIKEFEAIPERERKDDFQNVYRTFKIPKKHGGWRTINAPNDEFKKVLNELKDYLSGLMFCSYHTAAYAYINGRGIINERQKHQKWESKWFAKFDFHDFFGSTTLDFVMQQFEHIYPFSAICYYQEGREELRKALSLCFLDGGLPQGTPISPWLTNVIMIPFDHIMQNSLNKVTFADGTTERFVYTRYADDLSISSRKNFDSKRIEEFILDLLSEMNAPFTLNREKTTYGSSRGRNWHLGLMLNKDNNITVGYRRKKQLKAAMHNYVMDTKNQHPWQLDDLYSLQGEISFCNMVEKEVVKNMISAFKTRYGIDVIEQLKADIKNYHVVRSVN